jgi:DNA-binding NtrC family response regulator
MLEIRPSLRYRTEESPPLYNQFTRGIFETAVVVPGPKLENQRCHRVFVVDDEFIVATTLGMILCQNGFEVLSFDLPGEALRASHEMTPDLLITDVMMPLLSGIELAIQMREHCPDCKVLLFSGQPDASDLLDAARAKGHDFKTLAKPVRPSELLEEIRTMMNA